MLNRPDVISINKFVEDQIKYTRERMHQGSKPLYKEVDIFLGVKETKPDKAYIYADYYVVKFITKEEYNALEQARLDKEVARIREVRNFKNDSMYNSDAAKENSLKTLKKVQELKKMQR